MCIHMYAFFPYLPVWDSVLRDEIDHLNWLSTGSSFAKHLKDSYSTCIWRYYDRKTIGNVDFMGFNDG